MKKNQTAFAAAGALLTAVFFGIANYILTPGVVWFIYPLYAVLWWPLGVSLCGRKKYLAFSVAGSLATIAFLAATNYVTSPGTLWFVHAIPPLLCWPLGVYFKQKLRSLGAALALGAAIIAYYVTLNLMLTPGYFWAVYPIYAVLWWPMSVYFNQRGKYREMSVAGSVITIAFLIIINLQHDAYPWALYACYPLVWWPLAVFFGKKLGGLKFSILASVCTVLWYGALNLWLEPGSPWIMFILYAGLWWVLSVCFARRGAPHWYAAVMTGVSALFFGAVNLVYSPGVLWAHYPVYAMLWWPVTLFFARKRAWIGYAITASLMTIAFFGLTNRLTSPGYPWFIYPSLAILWWPLSVYFAKHKSAWGFSVAGSLLVVGTFAVINMMTSPVFLWFLFPTFAVAWWPLGVGFGQAKKRLAEQGKSMTSA